MAITQLNPYINFRGTAQAAVDAYQRILGAKVEMLMRYSEVPGMNAEPKHANWIVHCDLKIGGSHLMLSDVPPHMPAPEATPNNVSTSINFDDKDQMLSVFDALVAGGKAVIPPHDTFYGGKLGMLVDAHGVAWLLNYSPPPAK